MTDRETSLGYYFTFHNLSRLDAVVEHNFVMLRQDFDPTNKGIVFLRAGSEHDWIQGSLLIQVRYKKVVPIQSFGRLWGIFQR
jgi:hypothetical protein